MTRQCATRSSIAVELLTFIIRRLTTGSRISGMQTLPQRPDPLRGKRSRTKPGSLRARPPHQPAARRSPAAAPAPGRRLVICVLPGSPATNGLQIAAGVVPDLPAAVRRWISGLATFCDFWGITAFGVVRTSSFGGGDLSPSSPWGGRRQDDFGAQKRQHLAEKPIRLSISASPASADSRARRRQTPERSRNISDVGSISTVSAWITPAFSIAPRPSPSRPRAFMLAAGLHPDLGDRCLHPMLFGSVRQTTISARSPIASTMLSKTRPRLGGGLHPVAEVSMKSVEQGVSENRSSSGAGSCPHAS